jgi:hypothetical protein
MDLKKSLKSLVNNAILATFLATGCSRAPDAPYAPNAHYLGYTAPGRAMTDVHIIAYDEIVPDLRGSADTNNHATIRYVGRSNLHSLKTDRPVMIEIDYRRDIFQGVFSKDVPVISSIRQE